MDDSFKIPSDIPQDLILIQSIVGIDEHAESQPNNKDPPRTSSSSSSDDSIASSGSEVDSEDEIETELVVKVEEKEGEEKDLLNVLASDSDSDSDDSSSSSELADIKSPKGDPQRKDKNVKEDMEEEDSGPPPAIQSYFQTKSEVSEHAINVPDIEEVDQNEDLEKVGDIMNIVENVVIVKGSPSAIANKRAETALDSDTLLVFDNRKVLGYIYETFGPTTQPLYQVRFNSTYPLDPEKVRVSREVFHVPQRSNFVFTRQIAAFKGSDASNMNDEEPADHELEFSDDEAEAEHRRNLKKKRGGSRASSRQSTPTPAHMRDQDLNDVYHMGKDAYAERGPYDADYGGQAPSRPAPRPYNDPYSDEFSVPSSSTTASSPIHSASQPGSATGSQLEDEMRNRVRGSRGRGGQGRRRSGVFDRSQNRSQTPSETRHNDVHASYPFGPQHHAQQYQFPHLQQQMPQWPYPPNMSTDMQFSGISFQQHSTQPHINPLFASQFGLPMGFGQMQHSPPSMRPEQSMSVPSAANPASHWSDQFTVYDGSEQGGFTNKGSHQSIR
ncbi:hypothetical protein E1B28_001480 [Marasmius oreades]|uniref:H/ACA ribonucleoprotein complex non-core subunit NAF1 n=1 Tax=Marasmius oreades TaxID=181124 RepID=A0A9P7V3H3_9AGAR|nr:uncharacterized protein E1B28_001480 [Marasmius oreades]KAG7099654.1 hypothetical protein E1B28_001480 [Marasmius oreades]